MKQRDFIEKIYREKTEKSAYLETVTSMLKMFTKTVFEYDDTFIFELLQNADDSPLEKNSSNIEVKFRILDDYLIFSHSGKQFTESDIKGICDVALQDSEKTKDIEKTGYKGVGFKSVFKISSLVYILSNGFNFKFDKKYIENKYDKNYPWQLIPIWVEEEDIPEKIIKNLDFNKVNTIIHIEDSEKIKEEITKIFSDFRIILFLRNVIKISFYNDKDKIFKIIRKNLNNNIRQIYLDNILKNTWICKDFIIQINDELKDKMKKLDSAECPEKLRKSKNTKITFAALIENDEIEELENSSLYCYLPTKINYDFNFLINSEFLLNAARTKIVENVWNKFLFKQISICIFKWISELVKCNEYKYKFTKLITNKFSNKSISILEKSFNEGVDIAIDSIPFIPQEGNNNKYLKVNECIVDTIQMGKILGNDLLTKYYKDSAIADYNIRGVEKLIKLGVKENNINSIYGVLEDSILKNRLKEDIEFNVKVIKFLYNIFHTNSNLYLEKELDEVYFLLDQNKELNRIQDIYFPLDENESSICDILDINYINSEIYSNLSEDNNVIRWLEELGIKKPLKIEIIRKSIFNMIENNKINNENVIGITQFIFEVFKKEELNTTDFKVLSKLKILTRANTLELSNNCYLPDDFNPVLKLESILPNANYISKEYIKNISDISDWKNFFIKIGVKEKVEITILKEESRKSLELSELQSYIRFIDENDFYDAATRPYKYQHKLRNIVKVDFLEYTYNYNFSKSFWRILIKNKWDDIYNNCKKSKYVTYLRETSVISYLQYYVKNNSCIPGNDEKCYKANELYSNRLKNIVKGYYKFVDDEIQFSKEQEEFLGIKTVINNGECFNILKEIACNEVNDETKKRICDIYKYLVKNNGNKIDIDESVENFPEKLLALDGKFYDRLELYCFNVKELLQPSNSCYFINVFDEFKSEKLEELCSILGVEIITNNDFEIRYTKKQEDSNLRRCLKNKIKYLASIIYSKHLEKPDDILIRLMEKINNCSFYQVESLYVILNKNNKEIYRNSIESWFWESSSSIYYVGKWDSPLTMYSLSNSICSLFELNDKEREVELLLRLTEESADSWLTSNGYKILDIQDDNIRELLLQNNIYEKEIVEGDDEFSEDIIEENINDTNDDNVADDTEECVTQNTEELNGYNFENRHNNLSNNAKLSKTYSNFTRERNIIDIKNNTWTGSSGRRLISYVFNEKDSCCDDNKTKVNWDIHVEVEARKTICKYEKKSGRNPVEENEFNSLYNIKSSNVETGEIERYIQVKTIIGEWNTGSNVPLMSAEHMNLSQDIKNKYWLYVVEFAESSTNRRIYCIRNPFNKITQYAFDCGWKSISEKEDPINQFAVGTRIKHNTFGEGIIKEINNKGKMKLLIILFESGEKKLLLNLSQMKIMR